MASLLYKWLLVSFMPFGLFFNQAGVPVAAEKVQGSFHPFYVSVTEINHNAKAQTLEISCKIFVDDMESVLKQNYKKAVDLTSAQQHAQNDGLISDYISRHLLITADGKLAKLHYIGFEKESESVYGYFEVANVPSVKKLQLDNSLLQDLTTDQINIMHVTVNGTRKSYKLDYPQKQANFDF
jgi:hypothetical protein